MKEYSLPSVTYGRYVGLFALVYVQAIIMVHMVIGIMGGHGADHAFFINIFLMSLLGGLYLLCAYLPVLVVLRVASKDKRRRCILGYHLAVMVLFVLLNLHIASGISPQPAAEHWALVTLPSAVVAGAVVCVRSLHG